MRRRRADDAAMSDGAARRAVLTSGDVQAETLTDGARMLRAGDASFLVRRIRPGVVVVIAQGRDSGQFGDAVVEELDAELARFPVELELFVDAHEVALVDLDARAVWTRWLDRRRRQLRRVHMLTPTASMQLVAAIAGHHSRTRVLTYDDARPFEAALHLAAPGWPKAAPSAPPRPAAITRAPLARGGVAINDGACRTELHAPAPGVLVLRVCGDDRGILASAVFDELGARRRHDLPLHLFIDLRDASPPGPGVSDLWSAWLGAHRRTLASVHILSTTPSVALTAAIATWRSHTGRLVRHLTDPTAFQRALLRAAPAAAP